MTQKKINEETVLRNLTKVAELSGDRQITQVVSSKGVLKFRLAALGSVGDKIAGLLNRLTPLTTLRVKRSVNRIRPTFARAINLLHQRIRNLMNASEPKEQRIALSRAELILRALALATEGLLNQVEIFRLEPQRKELVGELVLEVLRDTASSFDRPDATAGLFRTLSQPGDEGKNVHAVTLLCRSWKKMVGTAKDLEDSKAIPQKHLKTLRETHKHLESFLHKAYLLIWSKPVPLPNGTLYQTPIQADRNQSTLEDLDHTATPVKVIKSVFAYWNQIPAFTINGQALEAEGEGKAHDYRNFCHELLKAFNNHCVVPASANALERQAQVLTDYIRHAKQLEDNEKTNTGLIDYPAPEVMGKLFSTIQPVILGGETLLKNLLGNLAKPVPFEAEALTQPPWQVKIELKNKETRLTQQRDFIIEDFMGDPIAYLTAEATVKRMAGGLWDYDGARALEICFRRSASPKQQSFLIESLPLADEDKQSVLREVSE